MKTYAVIDDIGDSCIGDWKTIVHYIFTIKGIYTDNPSVQAKHYKEEYFHSYNKEEFTHVEAHDDACKELFFRLMRGDYPRWKLFKQMEL